MRLGLACRRTGRQATWHGCRDGKSSGGTVSRPLWRAVAALTTVALALVACGNSQSDSGVTATTSSASATTVTVPAGVGGAAHRNEFKPISGVPGVTDKTIT